MIAERVIFVRKAEPERVGAAGFSSARVDEPPPGLVSDEDRDDSKRHKPDTTVHRE